MQRYTLIDAHNRQDEVFEKAATEPVLVTTQSHPSYVIRSAQTYQQLMDRLQALEDKILERLPKQH